ncbi:MAG: DUF6438 domain-containing protein [Saprospiraceae bacterium]
MKSFFLIPLASLMLAGCCPKNVKTVQTEDVEVIETTGNGKLHEEEAHLVAAFEKTACYGKCPVYQVKFYSDGKVTWYGKLFVDRMGWHEAHVEPAVLKSIRDKVHETGYLDFESEYPTERRIADLPSTITYVRIGDVEKQVADTHDAPQELKEFEAFLEGLINGLEWKASADK